MPNYCEERSEETEVVEQREKWREKGRRERFGVYEKDKKHKDK